MHQCYAVKQGQLAWCAAEDGSPEELLSMEEMRRLGSVLHNMFHTSDNRSYALTTVVDSFNHDPPCLSFTPAHRQHITSCPDRTEVALLAAAVASIRCKLPDSRGHAKSQPLASTDA